jgi:hypothetical protein
MVRGNRGRGAVALVLVAILIVIPIAELSAQEISTPGDSTKSNTQVIDAQEKNDQVTVNIDEYMMGKLQGQADSHGQPLWFIAGLGCGIIGVGAAYFIKPNPPSGKLLGQTSNYILGYTDGYKNKGREKNTTYACVGWVAWIIIYVTALSDKNTD